MSKAPTVLVVDDNRSAADALGLVLRRHSYEVSVVYGGAEAVARLNEGGVDVVLTDLRMDEVDGLDVLRHARGLALPADVLVFTGYGTVDDAVQAMRLGARDFLTKPVTPSQVIERLERLRGDGQRIRVQGGSSIAARRLGRQLEAMSGSDATVLLLGEPGSGRDQVARELHDLRRGDGNFIVLPHPAKALPAELRGAATLFLPNVDLLDARDKVSLVQLLNSLTEATPRVIASASPGWATDAVASGDATAQELYYRLAVLQLTVPPLRERPDDIEELLKSWVRARASQLGVAAPEPSEAQLRALRLHSWPGNLRELAAVAERASVFGVEAYDIRVQRHELPEARLPDLVEGFELARYLEETERILLVRAIDQTQGDRGAMSRVLGVERNTLRYKLNKYGLLDRT